MPAVIAASAPSVRRGRRSFKPFMKEHVDTVPPPRHPRPHGRALEPFSASVVYCVQSASFPAGGNVSSWLHPPLKAVWLHCPFDCHLQCHSAFVARWLLSANRCLIFGIVASLSRLCLVLALLFFLSILFSLSAAIVFVFLGGVGAFLALVCPGPSLQPSLGGSWLQSFWLAILGLDATVVAFACLSSRSRRRPSWSLPWSRFLQLHVAPFPRHASCSA